MEEESCKDIRNEELEFTYDLGDKFRIDIDAARQRKEEREQESKKNFEEPSAVLSTFIYLDPMAKPFIRRQYLRLPTSLA